MLDLESIVNPCYPNYYNYDHNKSIVLLMTIKNKNALNDLRIDMIANQYFWIKM